MNKTDFEYEVYKTGTSGFKAQFYNVIQGKKNIIGNFKKELDANKAYMEYQYSFYKEHKFLLPKNIVHSPNGSRFIFTLQFKGKSHISKTFNTVQQCLRFKSDIIYEMTR